MELAVDELCDAFRESGLLEKSSGNEARIERCAAAEDCRPGDLVFVDREAFVGPVRARCAAAVITTPELASAFAGSGIAVLVTPNVKLARALVMQRFFDRDIRGSAPGIHRSAVVHETARIAPSARIGPRVVVGEEARIGEDCVLLANVVVEERATIGDRTVIRPGAMIGFECEVGADVIIESGTVIGSEGFGFAQDAERKHHRIPQLGRVVVEDRVVIGAGCCIDRGTHGATRIGAGTIIDNLCHIAHNVEIGEDCILTAMLCVAGSTRIGARVITSGQVGIIDHLSIADDVVLLHRAGVTADIAEPGAYAGVPLLPVKEHMKSQVGIRRLAKLRDTVKELERRIAVLESAGS